MPKETDLGRDGSSGSGTGLRLEVIILLSLSGVFVLVGVAVCLCFRWRDHRRMQAFARSSSTASDSSGTGTAVTPAKKVSQTGIITSSEPIQFVLPSINLESGDNDTSAGEGGPGRIVMARCRPQTSHLSIPQGGALDKEMYVSSEGDDASTPSLTGLGKVGIRVSYNSLLEQLKIQVLGATNLPAKFRRNAADPHVKITLLPEKAPKFFTKIQRNTLNPVFSEVFTFAVSKRHLEAKVIKISVCDLDRFSRRAVIGYVLLPLTHLGITSSVESDVDTGEIWRDLHDSCEKTMTDTPKGEMFVSLCHNPDAGTLVVGIHKAKNLQTTRKEKDIAALYTKVTLFVAGKFIKSKKTSSRRKTLEPEFEESFSIQLPKERLQTFHLLITLCSRMRLGGRFVLGRTQIGCFAYVSGPGYDHWSDAFHSPKSIVAQWHVLT